MAVIAWTTARRILQSFWVQVILWLLVQPWSGIDAICF